MSDHAMENRLQTIILILGENVSPSKKLAAIRRVLEQPRDA